MCGIVGFTNVDKSINYPENLIKKMTQEISHRGTDDFGYYNNEEQNIFLGHQRLAIIDIFHGKQPMIAYLNNQKYIIVYNGEIYNYLELKEMLSLNNISLETNSDTEIILKTYILLGQKCLNYLKGIFSFAIYNEYEQKLFLARDRFGVKPLFYTKVENNLFFASEIKSLFQYDKIKPTITKDSICELFGLGPAKNPSSGVFENIYELKAGHFILFQNGLISQHQYFKLKSTSHNDDIKTTIEKIKKLVKTSVSSQLISDVDIGLLLSGGIDSSIITALASKKVNNKKLKTFSIDYVDNDINFKPNDFQPKRDNDFIELMKNKYNLEHKYIIINHEELFDKLFEAMVVRDMPSMADIDSSLLMFSKYIKQDVSVALSGEYADEIFCGYPWFYREDSLNSDTFPWSINIDQRQNIINKDISKNINIKDYIDSIYHQALKEIPLDETNNLTDIKMKKLSYLTMCYFGQTLLDRGDRMCMANALEVRVPFTDHDLIEYVYNIPWEIKNYNNMEKGILREAFKDLLPTEIYQRKKSPYPKTYDPKYTNIVKTLLEDIIKNPNNNLQKLVDIKYVKQILNSDESHYTRPWFGQLMTKPQLMAYLIQIDMWLKKYNIIIKL